MRARLTAAVVTARHKAAAFWVLASHQTFSLAACCLARVRQTRGAGMLGVGMVVRLQWELTRGVGEYRHVAADTLATVILRPDGSQATSAWELHQAVPTMPGVALGGGIEIDPLEAALAGLAGEPGANVGVNMDEVGVGEP